MRASPSRPRRRWKRYVVLGLLTALLLLAGILIGVDYALRRPGERMAAQAIADLDREEPGWRLADLEAARPTPPPERDGGRCVREAARLLPKGWPAPDAPKVLSDLWSSHRLRLDQAEAIRKELALADAALPEALKIADRPQGHFPIEPNRDFSSTLLTEVYAPEWKPDRVSTALPHLPEIRLVATLLQLELVHRAEDGDRAGALTACRTVLNLPRIIGDEPTGVAQLVRRQLRTIACAVVERTLAQIAQPSGEALADLQKALQEEESQQWFLTVCRAELAGQHAMFEAIASGKVKLSIGSSPDDTLYNRYRLREIQGKTLQGMRPYLRVARAPVEEQERLLSPVFAAAASSQLRGSVVSALKKSHAGCMSSHARARSLIALLAVERYRLDHDGRWPADLAGLTPQYLAEVPLDPFDGRPLHYRRLPEGVVVYSVGTNHKDDLGDVARRRNPESLDVGFRLWDVNHRRQPAPPRQDPAPPKEE